MKFLHVFVVFMVIHHLLLLTEMSEFNQMIMDVQHKPNHVDLSFTFGYLVCYLTLVYLLYFFVIEKGLSIKESFIFGCCMFIISDFTMFTLFENSRKYLMTFVYDILVLGGGGFAMTTYLIKYKYNLIKRYIVVLFLLYLGFISYI